MKILKQKIPTLKVIRLQRNIRNWKAHSIMINGSIYQKDSIRLNVSPIKRSNNSVPSDLSPGQYHFSLFWAPLLGPAPNPSRHLPLRTRCHLSEWVSDLPDSRTAPPPHSVPLNTSWGLYHSTSSWLLCWAPHQPQKNSVQQAQNTPARTSEWPAYQQNFTPP